MLLGERVIDRERERTVIDACKHTQKYRYSA